ncbi:MAG: DMT family transporter [Alphaproteobacteria bacterium]|nr:DMT family transporter [Alphaproteobacteria bacterium]
MTFPPSALRMSRPENRRDNLLGIAFGLASVVLFSGQSLVVKFLGDRYPMNEVVFFRHAFALVPAYVMLAQQGGLATLRTDRFPMHLARMAAGMSSMILGFYALRLIPLADTVVYGFVSPLLVTALSVPVLGERVGIHRWSAVLFCFLGVVIMMQPGGTPVEWGVIVALAGAFCGSFVNLTMRRLGATETAASTVCFYTGMCTIVFAATLPFSWVTPDPVDLAILISLGLGGGIAQYWYTKSLWYAPSALIAPLGYTSLIWMTAAGFLFWNEVPTGATLIGAAIICGSGLYILYREARRR